jgi:hypothetical protein
LSSNVGSFTCANNQSDASCTPLFPVAAKAFSLKQICVSYYHIQVWLLFNILYWNSRFVLCWAETTKTQSKNNSLGVWTLIFQDMLFIVYINPSLHSAYVVKDNYIWKHIHILHL